MGKTKDRLISWLILAAIHLCFVIFIAYPAFGFNSFLGLIPIVFLKYLPIEKIKINYKELSIDIVVFTLSILFTLWIQIHFGKSPVFASSLIGVFISFIPQNTFGIKPFAIKNLNQAKLAAYSGTFAGMTAIEHINNIQGLLIIGILGGSMFSILRNSFNGIGGKLGSIAFGSAIFYILLSTNLWN